MESGKLAWIKIHDLDGRFMASEVNPALPFELGQVGLIGKMSRRTRRMVFVSLNVVIPIQKRMVILISFTKGCSDRCELLGCYGSANWDMLSEVWYNRKGFLARKRGPVH